MTLRSLQSFVFDVETLSHEGRGVARFGPFHDHPQELHGKKIFIEGCLPGERVRATISQHHERFSEGQLIEVVEATRERVTPPCPVYERCGGCTLQHLSVPAQLAHKSHVLADQLKRFGSGLPYFFAEAKSSDQAHYRARIRLGVAHAPNFHVGYRAKHSHELVDAASCYVAQEKLSALIALITQRAEEFRLPALSSLSEVLFDAGDSSCAVTLVLSKDSAANELERVATLLNTEGMEKVLTPLQTALWIKQGRTLRQLFGPHLSYELPEFTCRVDFEPGDFTQANRQLNQVLVGEAMRLLELQEGETLLDLFSGLGNFSLPAARLVGDSGHVIGIEGSTVMTERARLNAKQSGLSQRCEFLALDLHKPFAARLKNRRIDAVLVDPPRSGAKAVMKELLTLKPKRIMYVSCNPATLARDSALLMNAGYTFEYAQAFDMFTHSSHAEALSLFRLTA